MWGFSFTGQKDLKIVILIYDNQSDKYDTHTKDNT